MELEQCLECQRCLQEKPGRQRRYPCDDGKKWKFAGLLGMLKRLFSKKKWREMRGRIKPGTHKREKSAYKPPKNERQTGLSAWRIARMTTKSSGREIDSEPPRVVTTALYGPNAMARNFFPDVLEAPPVTLDEREALRLTIEDQKRKLLNTFKGRKF